MVFRNVDRRPGPEPGEAKRRPNEKNKKFYVIQASVVDSDPDWIRIQWAKMGHKNR